MRGAAFYHGPCPLIADCHARTFSSPAIIRSGPVCRRASIAGHSRASNLCPSQPSSWFQHTFDFGEPQIGDPTPQNGLGPRDDLFQASSTCLPLHLADFPLQTLAGLGCDPQLRSPVARIVVAKELPLPRCRALVNLGFSFSLCDRNAVIACSIRCSPLAADVERCCRIRGAEQEILQFSSPKRVWFHSAASRTPSKPYVRNSSAGAYPFVQDAEMRYSTQVL